MPEYAFDEKPLPLSESLFVARLTDRLRASFDDQGGNTVQQWHYAWTEQTCDASTGEYADAEPARVGTTTIDYATETNDLEIETGKLVWLREKGVVDGYVAYEFDAGGMGGDGDVFNYFNCLFVYDVSNFTYYGPTYQTYHEDTYFTFFGPSFWYFYDSSEWYYYSASFYYQSSTLIYLDSSLYFYGGVIYLDAPLVICGRMFWCYVTYVVASAQLNNWSLPSTDDVLGIVDGNAIVFRLESAADFAISGIIPAEPPEDLDGGHVIALCAVDHDMILLHESTDSDEENRFALEDGQNLTVGAGGIVLLWYDPQSERWRVFRAPDAATTTPVFSGERVYRNSNQNIANETYTAIAFNHSRFAGAETYSDLAGATSHLIAPVTGFYHVGGHARFAAAAAVAEHLAVRIRLNGTTAVAEQSMRQTLDSGMMWDPCDLSVSTMIKMQAGDYVELMVYQNSGGSIDVVYSAQSTPEFWIYRVGI